MSYRILFMGSDPIALPFLQNCLDNPTFDYSIVGVFTQPDRRSGRGKKLQANAIKLWAEENNIPVFQPEKPGEEEVQWITEKKIDLSIVMAYGHILKKAILEASKCDIVNLHASLLPKLRGASPIETAIATSEKESGVTLMRISPKMDAGAIFDQEVVPIEASDTGMTLREKFSKACIPLIERNLEKLITQNLPSTEQDHDSATYCRKIDKTDGEIDWNASAQELADRIRAFSFWPKCSFEYNDTPIKVGMASIHSDTINNKKPGTILDSSKTLKIATGNGILEITQLQKPGGKMMSSSDFLRGFTMNEDDVIQSKTMAALLK